MSGGRLQNGDMFSFLRSFGGSLKILLDNSAPEKTKRRKFTVTGEFKERDFAKAGSLIPVHFGEKRLEIII